MVSRQMSVLDAEVNVHMESSIACGGFTTCRDQSMLIQNYWF